MQQTTRATRGGVGAAVLAIGLATLTLLAGWASGATYDGFRPASGLCGGPCAGRVSSAATGPGSSSVLNLRQEGPASRDPQGFPFVSAQSFSLIEVGCGAQIHGRDEHRALPPASLAKLMTAAVAVDQAHETTIITVNVDGPLLYDTTGSTIMGVTPGMQLSLLDLLYGLLLPSGNDAAIAIAEGIGGTEEHFVALMNEKARSLALEDTHFTNAHGLYEDGLQSSAYDMGLLSRYVLQNSVLREIVNTVSWQPNWEGDPVWNGNRLLTEYPEADGVKIGYTEESQQTIVASATRHGRQIIASVMRSQDRYTDSARLLDWAFDQPSACP